MTISSISPSTAILPTITDGLDELLLQLKNQKFTPQTLVRLSVNIAPADPLPWLSQSSEFCNQRCFFEKRDKSGFIAGFGCAMKIAAKNAAGLEPVFRLGQGIIADTGATLVCSVAHSEAECMINNVDYAQLLLPLLELSEEQGCYSIAFNLFSQHFGEWQGQVEALSKLIQNVKSIPSACIADAAQKPQAKHYSCDYEQWCLLLEQAFTQLELGMFQKVVLARALTLQYKSPPDAFLALSKLKHTSHYRFALEADNQLFFGCSPERLFYSNKQWLYTESLAGTVSRGTSKAEDERLANTLYLDSKLKEEHQYVTRAIRECTQKLTLGLVDVSEVNVLKLSNIQHAYQTIASPLKKNVGVNEIIRELHPTPAVNGYPKQTAAEFIVGHEPMLRGLYGGCIGIVTQGYSEFAVAIRSGILKESSVTLFSGVGIVKNSTPKEEWLEMNAKLKLWEESFGFNCALNDVFVGRL